MCSSLWALGLGCACSTRAVGVPSRLGWTSAQRGPGSCSCLSLSPGYGGDLDLGCPEGGCAMGVGGSCPASGSACGMGSLPSTGPPTAGAGVCVLAGLGGGHRSESALENWYPPPWPHGLCSSMIRGHPPESLSPLASISAPGGLDREFKSFFLHCTPALGGWLRPTASESART